MKLCTSLVHPFLGRVGENPLMFQDEWMFPFSVKHQLWETTKMSVNDSTEGNELRSKPWPCIWIKSFQWCECVCVGMWTYRSKIAKLYLYKNMQCPTCLWLLSLFMSFFLQFVALGPKQSKDVNNNMRCFLVLAAAGWKQRELCCSHGETQEWNHRQEVGKEGYQSVRQQPGKLLRWHECRNNSCVLNLLLLWSVDIPSHTVLIRVTNQRVGYVTQPLRC